MNTCFSDFSSAFCGYGYKMLGEATCKPEGGQRCIHTTNAHGHLPLIWNCVNCLLIMTIPLPLPDLYSVPIAI